jgi:capsular polysaccharide biosynthesis protein
MSQQQRPTVDILWRRLWIVLLLPLLTIGATVAVSFWLEKPLYEASAELTVSPQRSAQWVAIALPTVPVAEEAVRRLGASRMDPFALVEALSAEQIEGTRVIRVSYKGADPERAPHTDC